MNGLKNSHEILAFEFQLFFFFFSRWEILNEVMEAQRQRLTSLGHSLTTTTAKSAAATATPPPRQQLQTSGRSARKQKKRRIFPHTPHFPSSCRCGKKRKYISSPSLFTPAFPSFLLILGKGAGEEGKRKDRTSFSFFEVGPKIFRNARFPFPFKSVRIRGRGGRESSTFSLLGGGEEEE